MNLGLMPQIIHSSFSYILGENLLILMKKKHNIILGFWVVLKLVDRWWVMGYFLILGFWVVLKLVDTWVMGYFLILGFWVVLKMVDRWWVIIQCTWKLRMSSWQSTKFLFEEESTQLLTTELQSEFDCQFVSSKSHTLFVANQVREWIDFPRGC
jgi:hypothetical protein